MSVRPLTEYCTLNMGQSPDSKTYNTQGKGLPFYQGNADFGETHPITRVWCSAPVKVAEEGDILISVRAPIGAMNMAVEHCCIGRGLAALTPIRNKCSKQFLYYALQSKVDYLIAQGTGSTFKAISKKVLEATRIPAYSTIEQEQIAETIGHVDNTIAARRKQLALLDQLVKSRFIELFGDPKQNPKGYPVKEFDEISVLITDGEHATPRRTDKGIYLLSARNILNHALLLDDVDYIDEEEYTRIARRVVPQAGDVLISCSGSIGRCCIVPEELRFQMVRSAALIRFDDTIKPIFAEWLITSDELQRQISMSATQSSQANLFQGKIRKLRGYVPPMELQGQFAAFVEQTNKSKYYSSLSFRYCQAAANTYRQEWMTCRTSDF